MHQAYSFYLVFEIMSAFLRILSMDWIENEYGSMNIGDERLNKRAKQLLKRFSDKPMESIPSSCKGWSETRAAYRL